METIVNAALLTQWQAFLKNSKEKLILRYQLDRNPAHFFSGYSEAVDHIIVSIWQSLDLLNEAALVAVGGYGRKQLFPYSDIDLLILLPSAASSELTDKLSYLISLMWDSGLEVGHSTRTCAECIFEANKDITVKTNLLEKRLLIGNASLYQKLTDELASQTDFLSFYESKALEQQHRHGRFFGVTNNLEPNIKESPGGLRDLQTILWISKAIGLGDNWGALTERGILTAAETRLIKHSERQLQKLRIDLHLLAQRREDRLIFDYQEKLAQLWGFTDTIAKRASEQAMQLYYRAAKTVNQLNGILLSNLKDYIYTPIPRLTSRLTQQFTSVNDKLDVVRLDVFEREPAALFEVFLLLQHHSELSGCTPKLLRALWHARARINERFRRDLNHRALFMQILRAPRLSYCLRQMNLYGVLGKYLPNFGRIVGQMQHDLFHVYSVDEHILMVIRNLRRFANHLLSHEYPLLFYLISHFERPEVLYIAALFHDIAKGRGGDHSQLGAEEALQFCLNHRLNREDCELVTWLVREHLTLSHFAQKKDIYNPETVAHFANIVATPRRLSALYLLTIADIIGTNPKIWNTWKAKLLEDLYLATSQVLAQGKTLDIDSAREERQTQARALLRLHMIPEGAEKNLWDKLEASYFLNNEAKEIAWHTRLLNRYVDTPHPVIKARLSEGDEGLHVLVYTQDQPKLFARICAFFEHINYSIADAKIYTTRDGYALDTFHVFIPTHEQTRDYRNMVSFIEVELYTALSTPCFPHLTHSRRISRHLKHFPIAPQVIIQATERTPFYSLSIISGDQPGLLARIAQVLAEHTISVHSAKIMTLGSRVEDSFLITGPGLDDAKNTMKIEQELIEVARL